MESSQTHLERAEDAALEARASTTNEGTAALVAVGYLELELAKAVHLHDAHPVTSGYDHVGDSPLHPDQVAEGLTA